MRPPWSPGTRVAVIAGALYVVLTLLVATGTADAWDAAAREWFRPDGTWGEAQLRADVVVEGFRPSRVALVLVVVSTATALRRRSWRPVLVAAAVGLLGAGLVTLTKLLVARPDTHGVVTESGGSYPSGHVATVLTALGGCLLALGLRHVWAWVTVSLVALLMGVCLLLQAAHWFTDVVGGALLGAWVLAAVGVAARSARPAYERSSSVSTWPTSRVTRSR